jgi:hypothetical protein
VDGRQTGSALEVNRKSRYPFRKAAFQKKKAPYIPAGPYGIAADKGIGPLKAVLLAEGPGHPAAQHFRSDMFENAVPNADMAPKTACKKYPVHSITASKHNTWENP